MKKIVMMMAALLMLSTVDADAQGFLKKLKQKAQQAVMMRVKRLKRAMMQTKAKPPTPQRCP